MLPVGLQKKPAAESGYSSGAMRIRRLPKLSMIASRRRRRYPPSNRITARSLFHH
ncbi:hypothetical protein D1BOALGB6SA_2953 [Olavius sp. associated proteobacterium Delta 1]|nr:hypothetical protein D1BOALGB6SA_2953 [Olavius sp. associated proteobacterium Delta 1]